MTRQQSVLDALADAETLRRYLESAYCESRMLGGAPARPLNYGALRNLIIRDLWRIRAARETTVGKRRLPLGQAFARAAFRLVPGLRGRVTRQQDVLHQALALSTPENATPLSRRQIARARAKERVRALNLIRDQRQLPGEEWRQVKGYEGRYEVSNFGRVRSLMFINNRANFKRPVPLLLRQQVSMDGYLFLRLWAEGQCAGTTWVHRLVAAAFHGPAPTGYLAAHWDGDPSNNFASNLRWTDAAGNASDMARHGTKRFGTRNHAAKLTEESVRQIRCLKRSGLTFRAIASMLGMNPQSIGRAVAGRTWSHVS